jgi:hypothetical protein
LPTARGFHEDADVSVSDSSSRLDLDALAAARDCSLGNTDAAAGIGSWGRDAGDGETGIGFWFTGFGSWTARGAGAGVDAAGIEDGFC